MQSVFQDATSCGENLVMNRINLKNCRHPNGIVTKQQAEFYAQRLAQTVVSISIPKPQTPVRS